MFFHFHSAPTFHRKTIIKSAVILQSLIVIAVFIDLFSEMKQMFQIIVYIFPFFLHIIFSFFVKQKESWLFGAIGCTLFSMIAATLSILFFLE